MRSVILVVTLLAAGCAAHPRAEDAVLFEGARVIRGDDSAPIDDAAFVVQNGTFTAIGKKGEFRSPSGAVRVDLTGKTVMPALIDIHGHPGYTKGLTDAAENFTRENLIDNLNRYAYCGVGAMMSLGADLGTVGLELRGQPHPGALYFTAGRGLAPPNAGPGLPMRPAAYGVTTEAEARRDVQELATQKVDIVKIWVDDRNGTVPKLSPALYRAIIDEAHKHNLRVIAHIFALDDAKDLVRARVDAFAHLVRDQEIDDELMALLKGRPDFFFTLTLGGTERGGYSQRPPWIDDPLVRDTVPPEVLKRVVAAAESRKPEAVERTLKTYGMMERSLRKLNAAGVRIALGTDAGPGDQFFGWTSQHELELMVKAGMAPAQAIRAATRTPAEILRLDHMGTIAIGKSADFVVLDGNPLENIVNSRKIAKVYLRGAELDRAALKAEWSRRTTD